MSALMENEIIQYLKKHGESLDADIAKDIGLPLSQTVTQLTELTVKGYIMSYHSTKFDHGKKVEGLRCRIAGYIPPAAPGRKSTKVQLKLS